MIALHYPNPKKIVHQLTHYTGTSDSAKAHKRGLTLVDYYQRCKAVGDALVKLDVSVGDSCYPYSSGLYNKHGKARVLAICRHYDDYGDAKWDATAPFLLNAAWEDKPNEVFNCTVNYLQKSPPTGVVPE